MGRQEVLERKFNTLREEIFENCEDPELLTTATANLAKLLAVCLVTITKGKPDEIEKLLMGLEHFILHEASGMANCLEKEIAKEKNQ